MDVAKSNKVGVIVLVVFFGVIMYISMKAYLGLFFLALIIVISTFPVYDWFVKKIKSTLWASILTSFLFLLIIAIPLITFFVYTTGQTVEFFNSLESGNDEVTVFLVELSEKFPAVGESLENAEINVGEIVSKAASFIVSFTKSTVIPLTTSVVLFFVNLTFFMLILIYLYPDRKKFFDVVIEIIPLDRVSSSKFVTRFVAVTQKMVISVFLAAMAQGTLGGLMFWALGIPAAGFWTFLMTIAAFLPLGSGLIWVPAALLLIVTGSVWQGILLLLWGMIVISSADNILRGEMLKGGKTNIPEIITFLSALGGIVVFGFFGFIYGPIIAAGFLTALDLYREYRREEDVVQI